MDLPWAMALGAKTWRQLHLKSVTQTNTAGSLKSSGCWSWKHYPWPALPFEQALVCIQPANKFHLVLTKIPHSLAFLGYSLLPASQLQFSSAFPSCQSLVRLLLHLLSCLCLSKLHLKVAVCSKTAQKFLIRSEWISRARSSTPQLQILYEETLFYAPGSSCTWL